MHILYFDYFVVFVWIIEYGAAVNRSKRLPAQKVRTRKSPNQYDSLSENINDVIKQITLNSYKTILQSLLLAKLQEQYQPLCTKKEKTRQRYQVVVLCGYCEKMTCHQSYNPYTTTCWQNGTTCVFFLFLFLPVTKAIANQVNWSS